MANLIPFRGVRYNPSKVALDKVVTPPYDVIDASAQTAYYDLDAHNVIRLELGLKYDTDTAHENRYTRARDFFHEWLQAEILKHDELPALYLYEQEFEVRGEKKIRTGFLSGIQVEEYSKGVVLPHEETLPKHKADRLELLRTAQANFSPIFGLYADANHEIDAILAEAKGNRPPDGQVMEPAGVINRLWAIMDQEAIAKVVKLMTERQIFIADGHHRYETSLYYAKEMAEQGHAGFNYIMMALVNLYDPGLVVFPTHRLVRNLPDFDLEQLLTGLNQNFHIESLPAETTLDDFLANLEESGQRVQTFGLYAPGQRYFIFKVKNPSALNEMVDGHSPAWCKLDVSILHTLVLDNLLGIGSQQRADESNLTYTRDELEALNAVDCGAYQLAFFMNSTKVEEVTEIAIGGEKMPQKSTFFFPKIITGMVINDFTK